MAIFWTTPDRVISLQSRAVALAVINAIGNIGSAVSPLLIGILRDATGSFSSGLWFVAGLLVVGALVLTRIPMSAREDAAAEAGLAAQKVIKECPCVSPQSPISISTKITMRVWGPRMCTISRLPAWRPFWPRHAGASTRPVLSDALSRYRAD
jgi:MFS family permease